MNMYKCLSGIMHLGNVDFSENDDEQSAVRNKPQLQVVAVSVACSHCTSPACAHLVSCRCGCCDLLCLSHLVTAKSNVASLFVANHLT